MLKLRKWLSWTLYRIGMFLESFDSLPPGRLYRVWSFFTQLSAKVQGSGEGPWYMVDQHKSAE